MRGGPKFFGTALPQERWEGTENEIYLNLQTGNRKEKLNEQQKVALLHNNENQHNHAGYSFVCCFSIIHHVYLTVELRLSSWHHQMARSRQYNASPSSEHSVVMVSWCILRQHKLSTWWHQHQWLCVASFHLALHLLQHSGLRGGGGHWKGQKKQCKGKRRIWRQYLKSGSHPHTYKRLRKLLKKLQ